MQMGRASTKIVGNLVPHSSRAKIKGKRMLGIDPQDQSALGVKASVI